MEYTFKKWQLSLRQLKVNNHLNSKANLLFMQNSQSSVFTAWHNFASEKQKVNIIKQNCIQLYNEKLHVKGIIALQEYK